jgi:UDP:flavonoid glycosyltransferase YjiC (YdhE family)
VRVLCSCNALLGHLHPMLPLATALRDAGHDVVFTTGAEVAGTLAEAGFELRPAGPDFASLVTEALQRYPDTSFATPQDQQRFGFERLFSELRVEATIDEATRLARAFAPDLVVNETADFVGPLVATLLGVPNTTVGVGLLLLDDWQRLAAAGVARAWEAAGLTAPADAGLYRWLYLNQLPRTLQRTTLCSLPSVQDLRPIVFGENTVLPADLEHLGRDRPLVYVTFGTVFGDPAPLRTVIDDLRDLDLDVLVTLGPDGDPGIFGAPGPHVVVRRFVPQGAVLQRCRLMVTHGGTGSLVGALRFGVPVVVIPMGADQAENAERIVKIGAGRVVDASTLRPGVIRSNVLELIADEVASGVVAALRDEIAEMPPPSEVVAVLEKLVVEH